MIELKELSEVCDLKNGFAFKSKDYIEYSNTISLRMSNIRPEGKFDSSYNQRFLPDSFIQKYSDYLLRDGDLVIAMTDLANDPKILGVPTIVETNGFNWLLNQRVGKLVIKDKEKADKRYLKFILNHPSLKDYYKKFAGGGLQINIGKNDVLSVAIPLPPLKTQKQIASILDDAQALKQKTEQLLKEYDELAQSIFLDMFGDPATNPKNFPRRYLKEFYIDEKAGVKCGPFGGALKKHEYVDSGIAVWNMDNISKNGELIDKINLWINERKYNELKSYSVKNDDIIISRAGTVGKMSIIKTNHEYSIISTNLIRLRLNRKLLLPLFFTLMMTYFKERVGRLKTGGEGTFTHMNTGVLNNISFPYPDIDLQNQFAEKIKLIEQQKEFAKQELKESEDLFQALLQKAFKGELA